MAVDNDNYYHPSEEEVGEQPRPQSVALHRDMALFQRPDGQEPLWASAFDLYQEDLEGKTRFAAVFEQPVAALGKDRSKRLISSLQDRGITTIIQAFSLTPVEFGSLFTKKRDPGQKQVDARRQLTAFMQELAIVPETHLIAEQIGHTASAPVPAEQEDELRDVVRTAVDKFPADSREAIIAAYGLADGIRGPERIPAALGMSKRRASRILGFALQHFRIAGIGGESRELRGYVATPKNSVGRDAGFIFLKDIPPPFSAVSISQLRLSPEALWELSNAEYNPQRDGWGISSLQQLIYLDAYQGGLSLTVRREIAAKTRGIGNVSDVDTHLARSQAFDSEQLLLLRTGGTIENTDKSEVWKDSIRRLNLTDQSFEALRMQANVWMLGDIVGNPAHDATTLVLPPAMVHEVRAKLSSYLRNPNNMVDYYMGTPFQGLQVHRPEGRLSLQEMAAYENLYEDRKTISDLLSTMAQTLYLAPDSERRGLIAKLQALLDQQNS